ncbi:MAG: sensor histidine kinase [Erythrobacter sp.]
MKALSRLSLRQQVMGLVALGLIVAQAFNFALTLRDRQEYSLENAAAPAIARVIEGLRAIEEGRAPERRGLPRARIRINNASPIASDAPRLARIEQRALARIREDAAIEVSEVRAAIVQGRRANREARVMIVSAQHPGGAWVSARARGPAPLGPVIGALALQTLVILAVLLAPLLVLIGNVTRPLAALTRSARDWNAEAPAPDLPAQGPRDVRDLILAMNEMRRRIAAMLREKDVMLGAIGHDLRTPLASLRIQVEAIEDESQRDAMITQIERLADDFEGILSLARSGQNIRKADTDLARLVADITSEFAARGADITLAPAPVMIAPVDETAMRRAIANLADNAIRYGGAARIRIGGDAATARIIIEDDGPGIPDHRLEDATGAFVRIEPSRSRSTGGHGLGLAIAAGIVRAHGGRLDLANRPAGGLSAQITLPRS